MHEMKDRMDAGRRFQYAAAAATLKSRSSSACRRSRRTATRRSKRVILRRRSTFIRRRSTWTASVATATKTAVLYTNRAAAYLRQAEVGFDDAWEKVERDCRRAIERHPTAKAYMRCARALTEGLDRHGDALCCLAEALVLEPRNTAVQEAVGNLRVEHAEMSDHPQVLQSVEKLRKSSRCASGWIISKRRKRTPTRLRCSPTRIRPRWPRRRRRRRRRQGAGGREGEGEGQGEGGGGGESQGGGGGGGGGGQSRMRMGLLRWRCHSVAK